MVTPLLKQNMDCHGDNTIVTPLLNQNRGFQGIQYGCPPVQEKF
jgi:hypothetical protein